MTHAAPTFWKNPPSDMNERLQILVERALERPENSGEKLVFFRADDIAAVSENFTRLIGLFSKYDSPLSLAVVPAWLTRSRWEQLAALTWSHSSLWCWHQHGWRHANHSRHGKNNEFGKDRPFEAIENDLDKGKTRLEDIMGASFSPIFTPPWNRCDGRAMETLRKLGFKGVSRSEGAKPDAPAGLTECNVNVDLHTRKENSPRTGWDKLFKELESAVANGICGIMIHHQRMNRAAFDFLENLLKTLRHRSNLSILRLDEMVNVLSKTNPVAAGQI